MHRFLTLFSVLFLSLILGTELKAQGNTQNSTTATSTKDLQNYTLEQCIEYAIENRVEV